MTSFDLYYLFTTILGTAGYSCPAQKGNDIMKTTESNVEVSIAPASN